MGVRERKVHSGLAGLATPLCSESVLTYNETLWLNAISERKSDLLIIMVGQSRATLEDWQETILKMRQSI